MLPDGAVISDERVHPDVISEKEVLLKAAKIAEAEGYLDINNSLYTRDQPELLNAYIEVPILVHDLSIPTENAYSAISYLLNVVDKNGESLLDVFVNSDVSSQENLDHGPIRASLSHMSSELSRHYITKREAEELIKSQFPGQRYEGPIAAIIKFDGNWHSKSTISWYFTVGNSTQRSVSETEEYKEYLINILISDYRGLPDKLTSPSGRAAIDIPLRNPSFIFDSRMVQLVEPIYFFDKLKGVKERRSTLPTKTMPVSVRVIPVSLK
jgi:hypothetical protein